MRHLWLLRHAKSSWDDPDLPDHDRPLSPRGREAAARIATHLEATHVRPRLVVCSSARRARETLGAVLPGLGDELTIRVDAAVYTFSADGLLETVRALPAEHLEVMLVGHNPAMEDLASMLARDGERLPELRGKYPTGALAGLELDVTAWANAVPGCARLATFVTPRDLG